MGQKMNKQDLFDYTISLLNKLHVSSHILENIEKEIPKSVDAGLRAMLFDNENYSTILKNSPSHANNNVIYRFFDEFLCHYIFFRIPHQNENQYFLVGPYLTNLPQNNFYEKKIHQLQLEETKIHQLKKYYSNLPIIEEENILLAIINTLGKYVFDGESNFSVEYLDYEIPDNRLPTTNSRVFNDGEISTPTVLSLEIIEENYKKENYLMEAVSKGKLNKIDMIVSHVLNHGMEERLADSLRNRKNYMIILNTILRKAAENGNVHPVHINKISSQFARKIEQLHSIDSSVILQSEMIRKYCLLVKDYSLKKYSNLIGRVVTLISYDYSADLSLKSIAEKMCVNASYLSSQFKKECGETLTDYVNKMRMEYAATILTHSDKQVQEIAEECGILDTNYFIKLFKKQYNMTPTQYREYMN